MGKARIEIWDRLNTTKLSDTYVVDEQLRLWNFDELHPTGTKLNESGSGGLVLQATHPAVPHLARGNCVRLYSQAGLDARHVFTFRIGEVEEVLVTPRPADRVVVVDGEDLADCFDDSPIDPWLSGADERPVSQDRVVNWASPPIDETDWSSTVYQQDRPSAIGEVEPEAWPLLSPSAQWLLSRVYDHEHPAGDYLFRLQLNVPSDMDVAHFLAIDNTGELWVSGTLVARDFAQKPSREGFTKTRRWAFPMTQGTHTVGIKVTNWPPTIGGGANPAAFKYLAVEVKSDGTLGTVLAASTTTAGWKCKDLPSSLPGLTAPEILQLFLDEAQARGEQEGWTIEVHGTHPVIEEYSCRVGGDGATLKAVHEDLRATWIDSQPDLEGQVLHVWPKGEMDTTPNLTFDAASVTQLSKVTDGEFWNAVQGVWADGVRWRRHTQSIDDLGVVRSKSLQLGSVTQRRAVNQILDTFLDANAYPVDSLVGEFRDVDGKEAGVDYGIGDTVTDLAGFGPARCVGIAWTANPLTGDLIPHPEWDTIASVRRREKERALERLIAGFDGPMTASILGSNPLLFAGVPQTTEWTWSWSEDIEDALNEIDPDKPWQIKRSERAMRLYKFEIEMDGNELPDAWGTTTVQLLRNGVEISSSYRVSLTTTSSRDTVEIPATVVIWPSDRIQVRCSSAGGHVDGRITLHMAEPV